MSLIGSRRSILALLAGSFVCAVWPRQAAAAGEPIPDGLRLVFVEDAACGHCRKWLKEVGIGYALTSAGQAVPLVRRNFNDRSLSAYSGLRFTPTFLLVRDGKEIERIVGYAGREEFWRSLAKMLQHAGVDLGDGVPDGGGEQRGQSET